MLRVRTVTGLDDFVDADRDPDDYEETVRSLWERGASRPEWCFVAEADGQRLGRVGFRTEPTTTDPAWLGTLPPLELSLYGLDLAWDDDSESVGGALIQEGGARLAGSVPDLLEVRVIEGVQDHAQAGCRVAEAAGMQMFAEKAGYEWLDAGDRIAHSGRLTFRSIESIGVDAYREVMAPCGRDTLDRNDHYYWEGCGPANWAAQMTEYLDSRDAGMWLVGYADGSPVGYVAVARDDDLVSTIAHIGVVPDHRGHGYVNDLLAAGTEAARREGIGRMLSDVDVLNEPMAAAMIRNGHLPDRSPWHVWAYRAQIADLASQPRHL